MKHRPAVLDINSHLWWEIGYTLVPLDNKKDRDLGKVIDEFRYQ